MTKKEAAEILQKHISTYDYQLTPEGWKHMVAVGIVRNTMQDKIAFAEDAAIQIEAYKMAIDALLEN